MEDCGIHRILGHSEKAVAYMADGYARISGRPGVCMAQSVGAANLAAAMQDPHLGRSAVVAITGRHTAPMQYRNSYQEVPHEPLFAPVTKFSGRAESVEQLPHLLRTVFREATSGRPGPAHLDVAGHTGDVLMAMEGEAVLAVDEASRAYPAYRPHPDPIVVRQVTALMAKSQRPVLVADRGAVISGAGEALMRLARQLDCPVVTTLDAKDLVPETFPLYRGVVGLYGRSCANHAVAEADLVIYAGSDTSDHTTVNWTMPAPGTPIIQIDLDPAELGRNYAGTLGIQSDVRAGLEALAAAAGLSKRAEWTSRTAQFVQDWVAEVEPLFKDNSAYLRPAPICRALSEALPEDAVLVSDTGFSALWTGTMVAIRHSTQRYVRAAGSLGWAFPAALGAKCGAGGGPGICVTGGGGLDFYVAGGVPRGRRNIKTITVVNNNHSLAQGLRNLNIAYGNRISDKKEECYAYRDTDFAAIARDFDCLGLTVDKAEQFRPAFEQALKSELPVVIDVKTEFASQAPLPWVPE
jgi:acetolactate synthase-1/2/3 large subunit